MEGHEHDFVNASYVDVSLYMCLSVVNYDFSITLLFMDLYTNKGYSSNRKFIATQGWSKQTRLCLHCTLKLYMHITSYMHILLSPTTHTRLHKHACICTIHFIYTIYYTYSCTYDLHCNAELFSSFR